jgi:hypothetical protein
MKTLTSEQLWKLTYPTAHESCYVNLPPLTRLELGRYADAASKYFDDHELPITEEWLNGHGFTLVDRGYEQVFQRSNKLLTLSALFSCNTVTWRLEPKGRSLAFCPLPRPENTNELEQLMERLGIE